MVTTPIHLTRRIPADQWRYHQGRILPNAAAEDAVRYQTAGTPSGSSSYECPCPACDSTNGVAVHMTHKRWVAICWHCYTEYIAEVGGEN